MSDLTRKALSDSLKKFMETIPLDRINVSDIASDCGVSRRTFYYHFRDIYDLLDWTIRSDLIKILDRDRTYKTWEKGFIRILHYLDDNKSLILNIYNTISKDRIEEHLSEEVTALIRNVIEEQSYELKIDEVHMGKIARFYRISLVGVILDWVKNRMVISPEEIVGDLDIMLEGDFRRILMRYGKGTSRRTDPPDGTV